MTPPPHTHTHPTLPCNVNMSLPSHRERLYCFPYICWFLFLKYLSCGREGVRVVPWGSDPPVGEKDCTEIARLHTTFILRPKSMKCMICFTFSKRNENVASGRDFLGVQRILQKKRGEIDPPHHHHHHPTHKFQKLNILVEILIVLIVPLFVYRHSNHGHFLKSLFTGVP